MDELRDVLARTRQAAEGDPLPAGKAAPAGTDALFEAAQDRGWLRWPGRTAASMRFTLHADALAVDARVSGKSYLPPSKKLPDLADVAELQKLLGDAPIAMTLLPKAYLRPMLKSGGPSAAPGVAATMLDTLSADKEILFACLLGSEFDGRVLGIKVPALMIGGKGGAGRLDAVTSAIDQLSARYGGSWIGRRVSVSDRAAVVLENTREGLLQSVKPEERPAFAAVGDWLVFCSSMAAMEKVMGAPQTVDRRGESAAAAAPAWLRGEEIRAANAYAWFDLDASGAALRNMLAVYSLALLATDSQGSADTRSQLAVARSVLEALRGVKRCSLALDDSGGEFFLRLKLGTF